MYQSALGDAPLQGAGQGIGAGPSLWLLLYYVVTGRSVEKPKERR
jgi:hypothetical protein